MPTELDLRLLRHFVAVAEELHFTRAAARLYLTQQALSRDVRRLEEQLGATLFVRSTRRVTLTADGRRLLPRARKLLELHDRMLDEMRGLHRPLLVDLLAEGHTPVRVLERARELAPGSELVARFGGGMGASIRQLLAGELDVAFGRVHGLGMAFPSDQVVYRPVRLEPMALLLPAEHTLAGLDTIPLAALRGTQIDASAGNEVAPEWVDLAVRLLTEFGAEPSAPHAHAAGMDETVRHLRSHGLPILTLTERLVVPGIVARPLTDPVPLYPWTMVVRRDLRHPGLEALRTSADELDRRDGWLTRPAKSWLPTPDATTFTAPGRGSSSPR